MERRFSTTGPRIESRADGAKTIVGYAAVFHRADDPGTEYRLWENHFERVAPTAFDAALQRNDDARALFNHDPNHVLGRLGAGTLALSTDATGLRYEITPPDTQQARDVIALIERGDIPGSSFSFSVDKETWQRDKASGREIRTLESVKLFDVGPVTFPAYEATTTGMRAVDGIDEARQSLKEWNDRRSYAESVRVRARVVAIESGLT